jgi:opacity protein-like surface antigen
MFHKLGRSGVILIAVLATVLVTMAIAAVAAGAASSKPRTTTTLAIGSKATLVPGGLNVTVSYTCFPGGGGKGGYGGYASFGDIRVVDLAGDQGFAFWSPTCNNKKQTDVVTVPGFFNPGAGAANVFICGFDCNGTSKQIKIS